MEELWKAQINTIISYTEVNSLIVDPIVFHYYFHYFYSFQIKLFAEYKLDWMGCTLLNKFCMLLNVCQYLKYIYAFLIFYIFLHLSVREDTFLIFCKSELEVFTQ